MVLRSHDEYQEMVIAHALNALEAAEAREMTDHLNSCQQCRVEFDSWNETTSSLAFAAESSSPSTDVRRRILQEASTISVTESHRQEDAARTLAEAPPPGPDNVRLMRDSLRPRWSIGERLLAIAASLILVSLLGTVIVLWQRTKAMKSDVARMSRQVDESQKELARVREEKGLLTAPDARMASLTGTMMAKDASAMIAYDRTTGRAMLVANGLPPVPVGQAYQLWFIPKGKQPMPGGVFATNADGHAEMHDTVPVEGRESATFAVTLEQAGGAPTPQGKIYMQSSAS